MARHTRYYADALGSHSDYFYDKSHAGASQRSRRGKAKARRELNRRARALGKRRSAADVDEQLDDK